MKFRYTKENLDLVRYLDFISDLIYLKKYIRLRKPKAVKIEVLNKMQWDRNQ